MILPVSPEHSERLAVDVWVPQPAGLDDRPDVGALSLQFALQNPRRAPLGHLGQAF